MHVIIIFVNLAVHIQKGDKVVYKDTCILNGGPETSNLTVGIQTLRQNI